MLYSTVLLAASAFSGMAMAQNYTVDPNSISSTERANWCRAETNTCPVLCGGSWNNNTCDSTTLSYSCVCKSGLEPDLSKYQNTVATFECNAYVGQCLQNNAGNITAQDACKAITCGNMTASNLVASSTSSAAASSSGAASGSASTTGASATGSTTASGSASTASSTGAANALSVEYGSGLFVASLFGIFAYAL